MRLIIHYSDRLPPLAWVAEVEQQQDTVTLRCGKWVETGTDFFLEGAWAGDFSAVEFDRTECVFGSGAVLRQDSIVFVSSVATTDYLYWRQIAGVRVIVSNSLPLLLAATRDELNPQCERYGAINRSILRGFREHISQIPTRHASVQRLIHQNLRVDRTCVSTALKPDSPPFPSFSHYRAHLDAECRLLLSNARAATRRLPLSVVSTQSRGYDTTAVNTIARKYGIDRVVTIANAKPSGSFSSQHAEQPNDDGTEICQSLGLTNVVRVDRNEFSNVVDEERLLYATLDDTEDANFFGICRHLPEGPSLLLTGTLGEIWYPQRIYTEWRERNSGADLPRWDLGTHGLTELRLEKGFTQASIVYLGARNRDDLFRITDSEEMAPWHIDDRYNRPIPRRIAEQGGVAREAFGQRKMATVVGFPPPQLPWGEELRSGYRSFLIRNGLLTALGWSLLPMVHSWNAAVMFASPTKNRAFYYGGRLMLRFGKRDAQLPMFRRGLRGRLFCFAANRRVADYVSALDGWSSPGAWPTGPAAPKAVAPSPAL